MFDLQGFRRHALPLLGGLLHGLAERFCIMDDGFELRVGQYPQQVVQDEKQLGCQHVTVLYLSGTMRRSDTCHQSFIEPDELVSLRPYSAFQSDADASLVGDEA